MKGRGGGGRRCRAKAVTRVVRVRVELRGQIWGFGQGKGWRLEYQLRAAIAECMHNVQLQNIVHALSPMHTALSGPSAPGDNPSSYDLHAASRDAGSNASSCYGASAQGRIERRNM